eukprot:scaffold2601_cov117-Isochrysis_galbana.AAC.9
MYGRRSSTACFSSSVKLREARSSLSSTTSDRDDETKASRTSAGSGSPAAWYSHTRFLSSTSRCLRTMMPEKKVQSLHCPTSTTGKPECLVRLSTANTSPTRSTSRSTTTLSGITSRAVSSSNSCGGSSSR